MPVVLRAGVYSIQSVPNSIVPLDGACSIPTSVTESPSGSIVDSGTGIRVVCPDTAHAVRGRGCGAALAPSRATTSNTTVDVAMLPTMSCTVYDTCITPGVVPASKRTRLPVTKGVPTCEFSSNCSFGSTFIARPAGERSFSSTGTEATSPTRTLAWSGCKTGGFLSSSARDGTTVIRAWAVWDPLETEYWKLTASSRPPGAVMRRRWRSTSVTRRPSLSVGSTC